MAENNQITQNTTSGISQAAEDPSTGKLINVEVDNTRTTLDPSGNTVAPEEVTIAGGSVSASSASTGTNALTAPTSSTEIGGIDGGGLEQNAGIDYNHALRTSLYGKVTNPGDTVILVNSDGQLLGYIAKDNSGNPQKLKVDGANNLFVAPTALATPLTATTTSSSGGSCVVDLPGVSYATSQLRKVTISSTAASAITTVAVTLAGISNSGVTQTFTYQYTVGLSGGMLDLNFNDSLPAFQNGTNQIVLTVPAMTGVVHSANLFGWR